MHIPLKVIHPLERVVKGVAWKLVSHSRQIHQNWQFSRRLKKADIQAKNLSMPALEEATFKYLSTLKSQAHPWEYRYCGSQREPVCYASCYAVLIFSLFGRLVSVPHTERAEWLNYILTYQCPDGLFRDPLLACKMAENEDWWGWRHLTLHAIMAVTALGGIISQEFICISKLVEPDQIRAWLESRDWKERPDFVSNEVQNYGVFLQYARDFQNNSKAKESLVALFDWLDCKQDKGTGLWGPPFNTPRLMSRGVQSGYHLWLLYQYDHRPIQYIERIIDSCLATQNTIGGYGVSTRSSACEDIDSIDPLIRLSQMTDYRREDIQKSLLRSLPWVLVNRNTDGGFVFRRDAPFVYGHQRTSSGLNESASFPTWFRLLSLAYLNQRLVIPGMPAKQWHFLDCPGLQFI